MGLKINPISKTKFAKLATHEDLSLEMRKIRAQGRKESTNLYKASRSPSSSESSHVGDENLE